MREAPGGCPVIALELFDETPLRKSSSTETMLPKPLRSLGAGAAVILGGFVSLNVVSSIAIGTLRSVAESKRRKFALPCVVCKGKGFYVCKLCKGNATIQWSPLHDPIVISPCVCPTCDGNRVQRCLNCLGKGYG